MRNLSLLLILLALAACSKESEPVAGAASDVVEPPPITCDAPDFAVGETAELSAGLEATLLAKGSGKSALAGDRVDVHYTGWLFDPAAEDNKGAKFDSSVDRGELFSFPLGAGRVIKGWDEGVECMQIGEKRLLKIAPDMAYGDRGAGDVIPPGATLLFEVELFGTSGP
ncbi:MAG: FKBP-type peptidyl-prolyl cis-trans isomerase [Pseudomonadota bacterium]